VRGILSAIVLACAVAGCQGEALTADVRAHGNAAMPTVGPAHLLAADFEDDDVPVLELPALEKLPRTMWVGGAIYALVHFSPYVGQFGVLEEYQRADDGSGAGFTAGYRVPIKGTVALGIELTVDRSEHFSEATSLDATATRMTGGVRLNTKMDGKLSPFVVAGGGSYTLEFDEIDSGYDLSGPGFVIGGGVDYSPKKAFLLRAEVDVHNWTAREDLSGGGGRATTVLFALGAGTSF
jgi:hypothetical protein